MTELTEAADSYAARYEPLAMKAESYEIWVDGEMRNVGCAIRALASEVDRLKRDEAASAPAHASDCAACNGPALPPGPCDCGAVAPPAVPCVPYGSQQGVIGLGEGNALGHVKATLWAIGPVPERQRLIAEQDARERALRDRLMALMNADPECQRILAAERDADPR